MIRNCLMAAAFAVAASTLSGCGEQPAKPGGEPGMESKGSLEMKGKGNAGRPAPPAPPAIQPVK